MGESKADTPDLDARRKKVFNLMLSIVHGECTEVTMEEAIKYGYEYIYGSSTKE